jgi:WD40 repeat protein
VDVYGLGAILYHLLTATPPFAGGTTFETVRLLLETDPRPASSVNSLVDRDLETICLKCLEKEPQRRYGSAEALSDELERWLRHEPILARPTGQFDRLYRWCRRKPALATLSAALGLSLALLGVGAPLAAYRIYGERQLKEAHAYASDMKLAQQAWKEGNWRQTQALLQEYIPMAGHRDCRGFEWRYLWRHCQDQIRVSVTNSPTDGRAALSPHGRMLATVRGSSLVLLDSETGRELKALSPPAPDQEFGAFAFSPTDTNLLATTFDHTLALWNLGKSQIEDSITLSNSGSTVAFSPTGTHLAVAGGNDQSLELWNLETWTQEWQFRGTNDPVTSFVTVFGFTPDGRSIVTSSQVVPTVWDVASRTPRRFPHEHRAIISTCEISQDGSTLVTGAFDSKIVFWDLATGRVKASMLHPGASITALKLSTDGRLLLTGAADSTVRLWDVASGQQIRLYRGHQDRITAVFFSADERSILSSSKDGTIKLWDREADAPSYILHTNEYWSSTVAFTPDGKRLVTTDLFNGVLAVWDVSTLSLVTNLTRSVDEYAGASAALSPNGRWLAMTSHTGKIQLWKGLEMAEWGFLTNSFAPNSMSCSLDDQLLAVAGVDGFNDGGFTNRLAFWDPGARQQLNLLNDAVPNAACVAFAHQHSRVAVGYMDGAVRIWNYRTQKFMAEFTNQHSRIWAAAFSPDDTRLAAGGEDGVVVMYDVERRLSYRSSSAHSWWVVGLAFSPDGGRLASAESDGAIRLWDVLTMRCALELRGHGGPVSKVAFSPNGNLLASCGADGTLRLWPALPSSEMPSRAPGSTLTASWDFMRPGSYSSMTGPVRRGQ